MSSRAFDTDRRFCVFDKRGGSFIIDEIKSGKVEANNIGMSIAVE